MKRVRHIVFLIVVLGAMVSCKKEKTQSPPTEPCNDCGCSTMDLSNTQVYDLELPAFVPPMPIPTDNPLTQEGVELGRFLFWDPQLSIDGSISCGSCHAPEAGFSDSNTFSIGVGGQVGVRQSMALINLGWSNLFFWDGRAATLEEQIFHPITDPIEMGESVEGVVSKLRADPSYAPMFTAAFGSACIDSVRISKAVAQFIRTMVSFNSQLDRVLYGPEEFTASQFNGYDMFVKEGGDPADGLGGQWGADCFHCHGGTYTFFTDSQLHNNGLDSEFSDVGAYGFTGNDWDLGRFKTPTLRNIAYTAPYMHDGRFETLEEVIDHYNSGGQVSATVDPFMKYTQGGLQLSEQQQADLLAFLEMLSDEEFINNPKFSNPH